MPATPGLVLQDPGDAEQMSCLLVPCNLNPWILTLAAERPCYLLSPPLSHRIFAKSQPNSFEQGIFPEMRIPHAGWIAMSKCPAGPSLRDAVALRQDLGMFLAATRHHSRNARLNNEPRCLSEIPFAAHESPDFNCSCEMRPQNVSTLFQNHINCR